MTHSIVSSSAPGKIILFGEHAVVYGRPALAVPVRQVQATAVIRPAAGPGIRIEAADIGLSAELAHLPPEHPLAAVLQGVFNALGVSSPPPFSLQVTSTIPIASGLGSGAAVSIAILRAVASFLGRSLRDEDVSSLTYEVEKLHHGSPSGIDNTVITWDQPVYFVKGKRAKPFKIRAPLTLVIGDTGVAAPTREAVGAVHKIWEADRQACDNIFNQIGEIAHQAREKMASGDHLALGRLMDANHALLQGLTVSSPELDNLVKAARRAGALGAKLSGGGRGGNMIALTEKENAPVVAGALASAGARGTLVTLVD